MRGKPSLNKFLSKIECRVYNLLNACVKSVLNGLVLLYLKHTLSSLILLIANVMDNF